MKTNDLKEKTISGLSFRFFERILAQFVSTIVSIILARLLCPDDYGVVAIVTIIITICNVFVSDGLGSSLIQKKDTDQLDYSTIFWFSLFLSFVLYALLFFLSPTIAEYYGISDLTLIIRIMALRLPIASINSVQQAYVSKKMLFKKFFWATLLGTVVSGVIGIILAYNGFGPFALVYQYLLNVFIDTMMLFFVVRWFPSLCFSFNRLTVLFSFGWKILLSGLINASYEEMSSIVISKKYSAGDLSFYTKGKQFPALFSNNVCTTISNVMFPVFSTLQNDYIALKNAVRRTIRVSSYILFPLLIGFAAIARNFVVVILTDKWIDSVIYIQLFCIFYIFKPLKNINQSALKSIGKSNVTLVLNIAEKVIGIFLLLLTMNYGTLYIATSAIITYSLAAVIEAIVNGKVLSYSFYEQLKDIFPSLILSLIMSVMVFFISFIEINDIIELPIQIIFGFFFYWILSIVFKIEPYLYIKNYLIGKLKHR